MPRTSYNFADDHSDEGADMLGTGPQLRAARSMAGLTRDELAAAAGLGTMTITRLEGTAGRLRTTTATLDALARALEAAGVAFITSDGRPGVCMLRDAIPARRASLPATPPARRRA